jgi:hypothetical protein
MNQNIKKEIQQEFKERLDYDEWEMLKKQMLKRL